MNTFLKKFTTFSNKIDKMTNEELEDFLLEHNVVSITEISEELIAREIDLTDKDFNNLVKYCDKMIETEEDLDCDNITEIFMTLLDKDQATTINLLKTNYKKLVEKSIEIISEVFD